MDLKPQKPKSKDMVPDKPLATAIAKTKGTPADTKALEAAQREVDKSIGDLKKAMEQSHLAYDKAFKTLPDVTKGSPKPAGPVPIPYPVFSKLKKSTNDAVKTTDKALKKYEKAHKKLVRVIDKEAKTLSNFSKSASDDAAIAKKGLIASKVTGQSNFITFSMDVKAEGKNVARFMDIATTNFPKAK